MRLVFAFSLTNQINVLQTLFFIAHKIVLFVAIGFNYISYKYEDYSKIHCSLFLLNLYSLIRILAIKINEDLESSMSQEFLNVTLVINSNFIIVTTVFINTVFDKFRVHTVVGTTVALYALVLIH